MIVTQVDLRGRSTWETGLLTAESFRWPTDAPTVSLAELVTSVVASSVVRTGAQVITPASLDPASGAVRRRSQRYQGPVLQVGRDLQLNDLLVPTSAEIPVLLVTEHLRGALVSSHFTALRSAGEARPLWIWAVLNSSSGRDLRQRLSLGGLEVGGVKGRILDLAIPVAPLARQFELESVLQAIELSTHVEEDEAPSTWWRTTDLRGNDWHLLLATPEPERLNDGEPLESFADKIEQGKVRSRDDDTDQPGTGLPVTDIGVLSGRPPKRWAATLDRSATVSSTGDVLVAAVGNRAHATVATDMSVLDRNVIRIHLKDPRQAEAIAHFLNGSAGYGLRQVLLRGSTVPHLSVANLSRMPVPADTLVYEGTAVPSTPLALRLEHALWRS